MKSKVTIRQCPTGACGPGESAFWRPPSWPRAPGRGRARLLSIDGDGLHTKDCMAGDEGLRGPRPTRQPARHAAAAGDAR